MLFTGTDGGVWFLEYTRGPPEGAAEGAAAFANGNTTHYFLHKTMAEEFEFDQQ